jgi:processive 1,2-diacylglycerol beta-glucosyltransferase
MAAADLMVGKPGGLTTAEACAVGLPMILLKPLPGQEERNADHLCSRSAATLEPTDTGAARAAISLAFHTERLATMATAARQLGKPRAALDAAAVALALVDQSRRFNSSEAPASDDSLIPEAGLASLPCVIG